MYDLQIVEIEPQDAVSLFNTDIEVEFLPPADYYTDTHALNDIHRSLKSNPKNIEDIYKILNKSGRKISFQKIKLNNGLKFVKNKNSKPFSGTGRKLGNK